MPKAYPRPPIAPRVLNHTETAAYIGKSATWLVEHRAELESRGFPSRLPLVDGYDKAAIDTWLDLLGGAMPQSPAECDAAWMRASHG
jgi:hypothetical protein